MTTMQDVEYLTLRQEGQEMRIWLEPPIAVGEAPAGVVPLAKLLTPIAGEVAASALAATLLAIFHSVSGVFNARADRLAAVPGMTPMVQGVLAAAHALACEAAHERVADRDLLRCWEDLMTFLRVKLRGRSIEAVYALFLDRKDRLIEMVHLGEGTTDQMMVYPREVVRRALILDACAVILVHNHPGGDASPSPADIACTRGMADALAILGIALHDHVIVGDYAAASVRRMGGAPTVPATAAPATGQCPCN
jgi:DNA repair protein RadC